MGFIYSINHKIVDFIENHKASEKWTYIASQEKRKRGEYTAPRLSI